MANSIGIKLPDGTIYDNAIADASKVVDGLAADDVEYSSGVSVGDKLDNVPTFDTLTTSDNNKLLGVSVSGSDISVGAVDLTPVDFSSQINWNSSVTVQIIAAYRVLNMCIISVAIRASGLLGELAVLPNVPNAKYFGRIQDNNGGNAQVPYITVYEENGVGKLGVDVAASGAGLLIGEIVYFIN